MKIRLTRHAIELPEAMWARRHEPAEQLLERALAALARKRGVGPQGSESDEVQREAVRDMLDFVGQNRIHLEAGRFGQRSHSCKSSGLAPFPRKF